MARVIHFEINAQQPEHLVGFYEAAFGWSLSRPSPAAPYWQALTGAVDEPGIDGGLLAIPQARDQPVTMILQVESLSETLRRVQDHGGMVRTPVHAIPGVGHMAYVVDPEGREFGLMAFDAAAQ